MQVDMLTILGGQDKSGAPELERIEIHSGETCCIVGPTGCGKSRLLADIEWLAQKDTPSGRSILLDGVTPTSEQREGMQGKLVAQITQNMNFVLDMDARAFLCLHAESLGEEDPDHAAHEVLECANQLCGEPFSPRTPLTFLSGGQSRALMIADVACLGKTPIVLIDEIENAGINKSAALRLFSDRGKIVLLASHDPLLILQADFRIVIHNGGMLRRMEQSQQEQHWLDDLREWDHKLESLRTCLRKGLPLP